MRQQYVTAVFRAVVLAAAFLAASCSDTTDPDREMAPGSFALTVRGPTSFELQGAAQVYPGLRPETVETFNLVSETGGLVYRLDIKFLPPVAAPRGEFAIGISAPVRATFYIFDRQKSEYTQIAAAQSGILALRECALTRCIGVLVAEIPLGSTVQQSTITAEFHARLPQ